MTIPAAMTSTTTDRSDPRRRSGSDGDPAATLAAAAADPVHPLQDAPDVLDAVAESVGMTVASSRRFSIETTARGFAAGYELELDAGDGSRENHTVYLESNPTDRPRDGVLSFRDDESGERIAAWLYPNDPELPALAAAVYPEAARLLLGRLGLNPTALTVTIAAYRPGKRAVVRYVSPEFTVYLKVVRPGAAESLHARHELWRGAGVPAPRSLGWSRDGFIALDSVSGVEAGTVLTALAPSAFLDAVDALTVQISAIESSGPARASLASRLPWYLERLRPLLPGDGADVTAVGDAIERMRVGAPPAPPVTIHGDLHLGQIFVDPADPTHITGVLDIDTAGLGDPADDAAALYAHLVVTALHHDDHGEPRNAAHARALAGLARARWIARAAAPAAPAPAGPGFADHAPADPGFADRARAIAATHLLGHILGLGAHGPTLLRAAADLVDETRQ
ncbi:phosphotransferase family protein [Cryobacterium frigoriphilum]|nr:aminoglycoside phosphotransferase family protein [Cryobacterium frigoriphilum]